MENETRTIYTNKLNLSLNPVANYAMELTTVENLINCGMTNSNGINLQARKRFLIKEIERIEGLHKRSFTYPRN